MKIHIPTYEYAFIERDFPDTTKPEEIAQYDFSIREAFKLKVGIPIKEFNEFLDRQLMGEPNNIETYNSMSKEQRSVCQEIKKSLARVDYKQNKK